MSGYCTDIECPYAKIFNLQNRNMECYCVPDNEEDNHKLTDNWKKYGIKKAIGFIGYTKVFHFPNKKKPKWCPKE